MRFKLKNVSPNEKTKTVNDQIYPYLVLPQRSLFHFNTAVYGPPCFYLDISDTGLRRVLYHFNQFVCHASQGLLTTRIFGCCHTSQEPETNGF